MGLDSLVLLFGVFVVVFFLVFFLLESVFCVLCFWFF